MGKLTTHILDTAHGCPAEGVTIRLYDAEGDYLYAETTTNADGRCDEPILSGNELKGTYRLEFYIGEYFENRGVKMPDPAFLDVVIIQFGMAENDGHYHVPLLVSPYSYSTYRGS